MSKSPENMKANHAAAPSSSQQGSVKPIDAKDYAKEVTGQHAAIKKSHKKPILITFGVIVAILAVVYGVGAFYFSSHFFPNTTLNDWDLSLQTTNTLATDIQGQAEDYSLDIEGQGFSKSFAKGEAAIDIDPNKIASDAVAAQNNFLWFVEAWGDHDISDVIVASYDETAVADALRADIEAFNADKTPSVNASIGYDEGSDAFIAKDEVFGTQLNADAVIAAVDESIKSMRTTCELTTDQLVQPTVVSSDERMKTVIETVTNMFPGNVALKLNSSLDAATIGKEQFASWIVLSDDYTPSLNQDSITSWVDTWAGGLNSVGSERTWTREDGKVCTVSGGTYGWAVDTGSLSTTIYDTLTAGGASTIDIPCTQTADRIANAGERDWGAYVDIDISEQKVRYYDASGNLLHEADCITGRPNGERDTPTGVYYLNNKTTDIHLRGPKKANGEYEWDSHVNYWMPFVGNSVGLHDASWQSSFGGQVYKTRGSHGCVNLSNSEASWFYNNLPVGVCVITHN